MNNFNCLYNLILESIISQNKASRAQMLSNVANHQQIEKYLNTLQNKVADFLAKFYKSGQLQAINDKRVQQVINILKRNTTFNIQTKITLDDFIKQNQKYLTRQQNTKTDIIDYIDKNVPQFSQKKEYKKGVVIYRVAESKQAQEAVRKIIDMQWGQKANPWCLVSRAGNGLDENYNQFWKKMYSAYPKHIAFQNGQLLAFCANDEEYVNWWDRNDNSSQQLWLDDETSLITPDYKWSKEQLKEMWINRKGLIFNQQTQRWDTQGDIELEEDDIDKKGFFKLPFGVINGEFNCYECSDNLVTLNQPNAPTLIKGELHICYCKKLVSLGDMINRVKGGINYTDCPKLKFDPPKEWIKENFIKVNKLVFNKGTGRYDCHEHGLWMDDIYVVDGKIPVPLGVIENYLGIHDVMTLTSLQNCPTKVIKGGNQGGSIGIWNCPKLTSLQGCTQIVSDDFEVRDCDNIITLKGGPTKIGGAYVIHDCNKLQNIGYNIQTIKDYVSIRNCDSLISLVGLPEKIGSFFDVSDNKSLPSLQGSSKEINGWYDCKDCTSLTSLVGAPEKVGSFYCSNTAITTLEGAPINVRGEFKAIGCKNLVSLKGAPEYVGDDFFVSKCIKLTSLKDGPKEVFGRFRAAGCPKLVITKENQKRYKFMSKK